MTVDHQTLLRSIATSFFRAYPHIPDVIHTLSIEGLQGFEIPNHSNEWSNFVGAARLTPENADKAIQQVYDLFALQNRTFAWMLDSDSSPDDLAQRLQKKGLNKVGSYAGMVLADMDTQIKTNPAITIRKATVNDLPDIVALMDEGFGVGEDNRAQYEYSLHQSDHFFFLAYVEKAKEAVAFGRMFYFPDSPIAIMQDAVTSASYRGRGIYSSLMAKRIEVAKNEGMQAAVMQADRTSSAPICAKMGFQEISNLDFYVWNAK